MIDQQFPWARFYELRYPVRFDELGTVLEEIHSAHSHHRTEIRPADQQSRLIGESADMGRVKGLVKRVAGTMATVLINGESGTGKEVVARRIHELSGRTGKFVAINCGAIPEHLLESELFGHERGAFTGAVAGRQGKFELAKGGTLFLDEIGDMPTAMQVKLLRVLQERVIERVGGVSNIPIDIRVIAATHRNLQKSIDAGHFREDLYYRLSVFPIDISPLRDRPEDVEPLVLHMIARERRAHGVQVQLTEDAMQVLCDYGWPGNVRELSNLIERLGVINPDKPIDAASLPWPLQTAPDHPQIVDACLAADPVKDTLPFENGGLDLKKHLAAVEKNLIVSALDHADGVVQKAAKYLGMGRTTLVEKIRRHGLRT